MTRSGKRSPMRWMHCWPEMARPWSKYATLQQNSLHASLAWSAVAADCRARCDGGDRHRSAHSHLHRARAVTAPVSGQTSNLGGCGFVQPQRLCHGHGRGVGDRDSVLTGPPDLLSRLVLTTVSPCTEGLHEREPVVEGSNDVVMSVNSFANAKMPPPLRSCEPQLPPSWARPG